MSNHRLNPKFSPADFRIHPAMERIQPHWLVGSMYGRHLLKLQLRQLRPDLRVSLVVSDPPHEGLLDSMVDVLDLRDWPAPATVPERIRAIRFVLRMALAVEERRTPPRWKEALS